MILQALTRYYDILVADGDSEIAPLGYSTVGVSFALNLSADGELLDILPQFNQVQRGKKMVEVPRSMDLPQQVKRAVNVAANFLWDNSVYVLGISTQDAEKPRYSQERFAAFRQLHTQLLAGVDSLAARAVLAFLTQHDPAQAREHPIIAPHLDALLGGGNLIFLVEGIPVHQDAAIQRAWEAAQGDPGAALMQCLVTGEPSAIARLHPNLKRIRGAQAMGATLVGFNAAAYESYNRSQGLNSPVGETATFAYTTALNYLLSDANPNKSFYWGDTTVVYWAESADPVYAATFSSMIAAESQEEVDKRAQSVRRRAENALKSVADKVQRAQPLDVDGLLTDLQDDNPRFYILGLAPNAARVSVRFFIADLFINVIDNIMAHYRDLSIVKEFEGQPTHLTVRHLLNETVSQKLKEKAVSPLLAGALLRAILTNTPYPAAFYYAILNRVRADMDDTALRISKVNYGRAAAIKAYLIRKYHHQTTHPLQEVLIMSLNEQATIPAYLLGRLFAVLEKAQKDALGDVNASIKDRYFTSACASPRIVFPILLRLSQHYISKAKYGYASDRLIQDILNALDIERNPIPAHLTLDEQGIFILGYYHQRAALYTKATDAKATDVPSPSPSDAIATPTA